MSPPFPAACSRTSACSISITQTDANFVITGAGGIVEVQMTAETTPFEDADLQAMLALARKGTSELVALQKAAIAA